LASNHLTEGKHTMKQAIIIALVMGLVACDDKSSQDNIATKKDIGAKHLATDNGDINGASGQAHKEFHNCNFNKFIADKNTSVLAKNIYLDNDWNLKNDTAALALLDSLNAKDKTSRAFYFKIVTKTFERSDGYFSEGLGLAGKEYVDYNTKEFITYFDNKDCFTNKDLETWAKIVMLEFSISADGNDGETVIDDYVQKIKLNCSDCTPKKKQNINTFGKILKQEWNKF